jgi:glycerol kinase
MKEPLLLGIDAGTSAVKAALLDCDLDPHAEARRTIATAHPAPGWAEQDPLAILQAVVEAVGEVLAQADGREVLAAGLDHQGESVLAWEADGARPLTPVITWQDKRHEALLTDIDGGAIERSGLPLDPYFSAGRLAWLLANDPTVERAAEAGTLRLGTVDAFLSERLAGRYATDLSTASRTQLLAVGGRDWDEQLLDCFGLRREWLPAVGPSFGELGELRHESWPRAVALAAQLVDQQAALAGCGAIAPGEVKATYGTGVFVLARTDGPVRVPGLLPTVAWAGPAGADGGLGEVAHALDGGVFAAGALLEWLAGGLGLAADVPALLGAAEEAGDSAGVMMLPALTGLGAPWWDARARAVIAGLHPAAGPGHLARAALEAIAHRVADIVEILGETMSLRRLRVDGGLSRDPTLLGLQATATGLPLAVARADATVTGAAMLAGVGAGMFNSVMDGAERLGPMAVVESHVDEQERLERRRRWREFVARAGELSEATRR